VGVEKLCESGNDLLVPKIAFRVLFPLSGDCLSGGWRLSQEPHQSLDILRSRCHEELLANELHSSQAQAAQSDLIFQLSTGTD